jgi:hypothetical protein
MTTPVGDDGWVQIGVQIAIALVASILTAIGTAWGTVRWLLHRIDEVRVNSEQKIDAVRSISEKANDKLRTDVLAQLDAHRAEYRDDRTEAQRWREGVLATMLTRAEADRMLDRQNETLLDRLDIRFRPLIDEIRKTRGNAD